MESFPSWKIVIFALPSRSLDFCTAQDPMKVIHRQSYTARCVVATTEDSKRMMQMGCRPQYPGKRAQIDLI